MAAAKPVTSIVKLPFDAPTEMFTVVRRPEGWVFVTVVIDSNGQISKVDTTEPNQRDIVTSYFKIAAQKNWNRQ